jgi:hypothetical protein
MPDALRLSVTDYVDPTRWRWVLSDGRGQFLADHAVRLDRASREYDGFVELGPYLDFYRPIRQPEEQLRELGRWIGAQVFGGLRPVLAKQRRAPARAVQVLVPEPAQELLTRPFELACFDTGQTFGEAGLRFVYQLDATPTPGNKRAHSALRVLAAFSLPVRANPLNLRRERYGLQRLVRELNQTRGQAIELRVVQYGATRDTLREALEDAAGWDIVHLSGRRPLPASI